MSLVLGVRLGGNFHTISFPVALACHGVDFWEKATGHQGSFKQPHLGYPLRETVSWRSVGKLCGESMIERCSDGLKVFVG